MPSDPSGSLTGVAECRRNANEILRRARATKDPDLKAVLLTMFRTWAALAALTERMEHMAGERSTGNR